MQEEGCWQLLPGPYFVLSLLQWRSVEAFICRPLENFAILFGRCRCEEWRCSGNGWRWRRHAATSSDGSVGATATHCHARVPSQSHCQSPHHHCRNQARQLQRALLLLLVGLRRDARHQRDLVPGQEHLQEALHGHRLHRYIHISPDGAGLTVCSAEFFTYSLLLFQRRTLRTRS